MLLLKRKKRVSRSNGTTASLRNRLKEKADPSVPSPASRHLEHAIDVLVLAAIEDRAEIKDGLADHSAHEEMQCDQHPPDAAVAIRKRVDCLELIVDESRIDEIRHPPRSSR